MMLLRLMLSALFGVSGWALESKSAHREPYESYTKYTSTIQNFSVIPGASSVTANAAAQSYSANLNLPPATAYPTLAAVEAVYKNMRDERWLTESDRPGFLRRPSWLFPDDGCFARAAVAIMDFVRWKLPVPSKVFVFGDLSVQTANSPTGFVTWWFHVAPLVQVGAQKYVLDPALNPHQPLPLEKWLALMTPTLSSVQVAVCNSGAYTPTDECDKATDGVEAGAIQDQDRFLNEEWSRLQALNRSPDDELGGKPPW